MRTERTSAAGVEEMSLSKVTENGKVRYMALSPDGEYVTFALREGLTQSLWIRDVRTGNELQLLAPDTVNFPSLAFFAGRDVDLLWPFRKDQPDVRLPVQMSSAGGPVEQ